MTTMSLRKLSIALSSGTLLAGVRDGLSVSDYAFDVGLAKLSFARENGLALDREALRNDVQRAQTEFNRLRTKPR